MYGMSAAHKTLPLGVYVRVTHLGTGKQVVVRVNDRGPFVAGRIIDLSYGAAKQLGIVKSGTAKVEIEALGYRGSGSGKTVSNTPVDYDSGSFAVQIGAFSAEQNAQRLAAEMRSRYGRAAVATTQVNGQRLYRVRVGDFKSLEQAEAALQNFVSSGFSGSYVVAFE
jgi:rare lipoprotein A